MSNFTCQSKSFISIFFTCQVSACELQPFSCHDWQMTYSHKLPKLCSATLSNSPDKNDSNYAWQRTCWNARTVLTFLLSVLTSDWLKQQKLTKLHKAVHIFILTFNHLPYNKIWSQFE